VASLSKFAHMKESSHDSFLEKSWAGKKVVGLHIHSNAGEQSGPFVVSLLV